jgi:peptidylprolyl isomerase
MPELNSKQAAKRSKPEVDVEKFKIDRLAAEKLIVDTLEESDLDDPAKVEKGDTVSVNYLGTLTDGTEFDNSFDRGQAFEFEVGAGRVIAGWDQGLEGAKVGQRLLLLIPSHLAYKERGVGSIPPGADLVFIVDVVSVSK